MAKARRRPNQRQKGAPVVSKVRLSPHSTPALITAHGAIRDEIARLRGLIATYEGLIADLEHMQSRIAHTEAPQAARSYAETAAAVLAAHGKPMQLKDLIAAMEAHGVRLTGATPRNRRTNLIIAMKRSGQFTRLGEGMYTLADGRAA